ncbi:MAG: 50S ribosomal protein L22 [Candidatus Omnitrophota bacterium]|nr:50S ribosomal protein L22 [Candidatus Omnitrophota bacterium]
MIAKAEAKYVKISSSKAKLVVDLIKGMAAKKAMSILENVNKKAAYLLQKVLKSAISNAKNKGYEEDKLFISKIVANPGPMLKRYRSATFGRATTIRKRTSHLLVELDTTEKIIEKAKIK